MSLRIFEPVEPFVSSLVETRPQGARSLNFLRGQRKGQAGSISLLFLLAACGGSTEEAAIQGSEPIACRIPGQSEFKMECTIDRMRTPAGQVLTARAPDGGFRRFLVVQDGRGVIAADGAEPVTVKPFDKDHIEVIADDVRYRLPAKVTG